MVPKTSVYRYTGFKRIHKNTCNVKNAFCSPFIMGGYNEYAFARFSVIDSMSGRNKYQIHLSRVIR